MNSKRLNNWLISLFFFLLLSLIINFSFLSCTFLSNDPTDDSESRKIEIYWPTSNSPISEGETKIEYSVTSPYNIRFIELYINGQFIKNIPAGANNSLPLISFNFDSTKIGTSFNYYLVYYDIDGTSAKSQDILNVTIIERQIPPYPPYDLKIIKISDNEINISWKDSSKTVNRYEIYRKNGFYSQYLLLKVVDGSSFNTNDPGLIFDSIYFYKIKSFNDYGESGFSEEVNTGGIIIYGDIYPPTQLKATALGTQVVALEWIDNSDNENFFRIERKTEFSEFIEITNISPNVTIFTDIGGNLYAGGTFFYRVKAFSEKDSAISNVANVTTFDHNLLPPAQLTEKYQSTLQLVELNWVKTDYRTLYFEIERKNELGNYNLIGSINAVNTIYIDSGIESNSTYSYRVRGYDGNYYSDYSNEVSVIVN